MHVKAGYDRARLHLNLSLTELSSILVASAVRGAPGKATAVWRSALFIPVSREAKAAFVSVTKQLVLDTSEEVDDLEQCKGNAYRSFAHIYKEALEDTRSVDELASEFRERDRRMAKARRLGRRKARRGGRRH
jgi:hypothetical protein